MESLIQDISDTAFWVANYRALESKRPDAVFRDPLADKLLGEKGRRILDPMPLFREMSFAIIIRTSAIDRLIQSAIARHHIDTVINLGAGLDTRPYRMNLPSTLHWIEVDLPKMIAYKNETLRGELPVCRLRRIAADLTDIQIRESLFSDLGAKTRTAVVITEGLMGYLSPDQARSFSQSLRRIPSFHLWIMDYRQGRLRNWGRRRLAKKLQSTPLQFNVADTLGFFRKDGWFLDENIFILDEAERVGRALPKMFPWSLLSRVMPKTIRRLGNKTFGYALWRQPETDPWDGHKAV